ncbi:MAG: DNA polymerase III subunit alpha, partial [Hyphomicrobiaceae bacterium]
ANRLDPRSINKRGLETLAAAGAFESLVKDRALVHMNAEIIIGAAQRTLADRESGQNSLFDDEADAAPLELRPAKSWRTDERLTREFEAIGFYLSGHPLDDYESVYESLGITPWRAFEDDIVEGASSTGTLAATVSYVNERRSQRGNQFAFVGFSDPTGQYEAIVFSEMLNASRDLLHSGEPLLVRVEAKREDDVVKVNAQGIELLDKASGSAHKTATIILNGVTRFNEVAESLVKKGRGEVRMVVRLPEKDREVHLRLPGKYDLSQRTLSELRASAGVLSVETQ